MHVEIIYPAMRDPTGSLILPEHRFHIEAVNASPEEIWRDFNTVDGHEFTASAKVRSMMVGDIIIFHKHPTRHYIVNGVGFFCITPDAVGRYLRETTVLQRLLSFDLRKIFAPEELVDDDPGISSTGNKMGEAATL